MESKTEITKLHCTQIELEKQFEYVNSLIELHRVSAVVNVNVEVLLTSWEVGQYISKQFKISNWGTKVVSELADYLKIQNPKRKGFSKRNLYNMVKFYETYSQVEFLNMTEHLHLFEFVQLGIAQLEQNKIVQLSTAQLTSSEINLKMPLVLTITTFTNHIEIINRCNSYEERIFYMLYASQYGLKTDEIRRCIVNQTYLSLMSKDKMLSPKMKAEYSNVDRDVKRENENPSIGIILCPSADRSMVEYTLSRSLSPTMIAEYQRKLIPLDVMQKSLEEYCTFLNNK